MSPYVAMAFIVDVGRIPLQAMFPEKFAMAFMRESFFRDGSTPHMVQGVSQGAIRTRTDNGHLSLLLSDQIFSEIGNLMLEAASLLVVTLPRFLAPLVVSAIPLLLILP